MVLPATSGMPTSVAETTSRLRPPRPGPAGAPNTVPPIERIIEDAPATMPRASSGTCSAIAEATRRATLLATGSARRFQCGSVASTPLRARPGATSRGRGGEVGDGVEPQVGQPQGLGHLPLLGGAGRRVPSATAAWRATSWASCQFTGPSPAEAMSCWTAAMAWAMACGSFWSCSKQLGGVDAPRAAQYRPDRNRPDRRASGEPARAAGQPARAAGEPAAGRRTAGTGVGWVCGAARPAGPGGRALPGALAAGALLGVLVGTRGRRGVGHRVLQPRIRGGAEAVRRPPPGEAAGCDCRRLRPRYPGAASGDRPGVTLAANAQRTSSGRARGGPEAAARAHGSSGGARVADLVGGGAAVPLSLDGHVVVTGAQTPAGRAVALGLAAAGAVVVALEDVPGAVAAPVAPSEDDDDDAGRGAARRRGRCRTAAARGGGPHRARRADRHVRRRPARRRAGRGGATWRSTATSRAALATPGASRRERAEASVRAVVTAAAAAGARAGSCW